MQIPVRAKRRQQRERMVRRALVILDWQGWALGEPEKLHKMARQRADNFQVCSCTTLQCANKRRWSGHPLTKRELHQKLTLQEWITWGE